MLRIPYIAILFINFYLISCSNEASVMVQVESTTYPRKDLPVHTSIELPKRFKSTPIQDIDISMSNQNDNFREIPGQLTKNDDGTYQLWWILPVITADRSQQWKATFHAREDFSEPTFNWVDDPGKHLDLIYGKKKVFRDEYELDSQFISGHTLTEKNKVFYHIFDLEGENLITNGYEEGVWSHQRGIMIGWRDVGWRGKELSFWGMEDLTTQKHIKFIKKTAGPVLAQVESLIHWDDSTGTTLIEEHRMATIYHQQAPAILLLDFSSKLKAVNGAVNLDGNAEHAGVQYRAHNDVAAEAPGSVKPSYFFPSEDTDPTVDYNLPWVGMSYGLNNKTYSVIEMSDKDNPKPSIWSAYRDYGRFGPYIKYHLDDGETLKLNYRFRISESTMPQRKMIEAMYEGYQNSPNVTVE